MPNGPENPLSQSPDPNTPPPSMWKRPATWLLLVPGLAVAGLLFYLSVAAIKSDGGLQNITYVRGWITLIVCLTAVALSGVLVYQAFSAAPDIDDRFRRAREIYTGFMAILATIVGFYFGTAANEPKPATGAPLAAPTLKLQDTVLAIQPNGGKSPFRLKIVVGDKPPIEVSTEGLHLQTLAPVPPPKTEIKVEVTDAAGKTQQGTLAIK